jgi:hypothetical protein
MSSAARVEALDPLHVYRLDDGTLCVAACPDEVAAVLDEPEPGLRETTFTDLEAAKGIDVRTVDWLSAELHALYRNQRTPRVTDSPWEGPRILFTHFIGESRIWNGPPNGHPCAWHGKKLGPEEYCLGCDRCGCESIVPRPPKDVVARCRRAEEERRKAKDGGTVKGKRLKGGRDR